jgi:hypothetical protein
MKRLLLAVTLPGFDQCDPGPGRCFAQAAQVRPALGGPGEWEAFITNCIATRTAREARPIQKAPLAPRKSVSG